MYFLARICLLACLLPACAERTPKLYRHVPKVPAKQVAVGTAAAAALMTLADPNAASRNAEMLKPTREPEVRGNSEAVPAALLDQLDSAEQKADIRDRCRKTPGASGESAKATGDSEGNRGSDSGGDGDGDRRHRGEGDEGGDGNADSDGNQRLELLPNVVHGVSDSATAAPAPNDDKVTPCPE